MDRKKGGAWGILGAAAPMAAALAIAAGTAILLLGFEALKEAFAPGLSKWESHLATVAVAWLFSGLIGYVASRLFYRVNQGLSLENAQRLAAEEAANRATAEKTALLRELQHRAKNSFAMISSLVDLARDESSSPEASRVLSETGARVSAIAELYDLLYSSGSAREVESSEYLGRIAELLSEAPGLRLRKELECGVVAADEAIPLGLIVTELATNAIKHAFPEGREGEIRLATRFDEGGMSLDFSDDGIGMPSAAAGQKPGSLGLTLVKSLAGQLGGSWELRASAGAGEPGAGAGTAWRFTFPGLRRRAD